MRPSVAPPPRPSAASETCRFRTLSPAITSFSVSGSTSTSRVSSTATSGPPISRPRSTWSSSGHPAVWLRTPRSSSPGCRAKSRRLNGQDPGVSRVPAQPGSGYHAFDGGVRSRVDINAALPTRAADLVDTVAHETSPGHHLEHAWKEADLVERQGRVESSLILLNTPESLISEGLAVLGVEVPTPPDEEVDLL